LVNFDFINKFLEIEPDEILTTLKTVINFQSGYIYYTNPTRLEYSSGENDGKVKLVEDLKVKSTKFGQIVITGKSFNDTEMELFKTCSVIISNILKDKEISNIMKMQAQALQDGYLKIKEAEQTKSKFLSHISHELRTPLSSILGFTELLPLIGTLNDKQKDYVNDIKISSLHLLEMINEILDISKIEAGAINLNLKEFEIEQVVNEVINIINPLLLKKNQQLVKKIDNFLLKADYQKLQQILLNLLSNAIKFTPDGGCITIEASLKDKILISVEDNGIGIAKEYQEKIFQKFEQVDSNIQNSTGLGLTITKELVKLHGGTINLTSEVNKGSKFIIALPTVL
jgi:signal transduction histidine kinase